MKNIELSLFIPIGRILLSSLFILGGVNKLLNYSATLELMQSVGLEPSVVLLPLTILLEIGAGLLIAIGRWFKVFAAMSLALFTLVANFYFHDFWHYEGTQQTTQLALFFKNISIIGALLLFAGVSDKTVRSAVNA